MCKRIPRLDKNPIEKYDVKQKHCLNMMVTMM